MIFRKEWLALDDDQFSILTMLAEKGDFEGTIKDICLYLKRVPDSRKKKKVKNAIFKLEKADFITCDVNETIYSIKVQPKGKEIRIRDNWINFDRLKKGRFSESIGWVKLLKVLVWLVDNGESEMTNSILAQDTKMSETSVINAKNVLKKDYKVLLTDYTYYPVVKNGIYRRKGQIPQLNAWSSTPAEKVQKSLE